MNQSYVGHRNQNHAIEINNNVETLYPIKLYITYMYTNNIEKYNKWIIELKIFVDIW